MLAALASNAGPSIVVVVVIILSILHPVRGLSRC